jgi:hypothetical protein
MSDDDEGGRPPLDIVPAPFVIVKPKYLEPEPIVFRDRLLALKGSLVDVMANGLRYRGTLVGADEEEIYLRGEMRYIVIALDRVSSVQAVVDVHRPLGGYMPSSTLHDVPLDDALARPNDDDDGGVGP